MNSSPLPKTKRNYREYVAGQTARCAQATLSLEKRRRWNYVNSLPGPAGLLGPLPCRREVVKYFTKWERQRAFLV